MERCDFSLEIKKPATELLDIDFHIQVEINRAIHVLKPEMTQCYEAIMTFCNSACIDDRRRTAIRIGQWAWEAARAWISVGTFLFRIADNWTNGLKDGREPFDWLHMDWNDRTQNVYLAKTLRHFIAADAHTNIDKKIQHLAALFCCANILWRRCGDTNQRGE